MFLIIIFTVQFYFLAKVFKKNKLKTVLSALALYLLGIVLASIVFTILIQTGYIQLDIFNQQEIIDYFVKTNYNVYVEFILFVGIGIVYFNYTKRKWMKELLVKSEPALEEFRDRMVKQEEKFSKVSKFYTHFHQVNDKNIHLVPHLAQEIWNDCYKDILSQEQIDFMLNMMYNVEKINEGIANGEHWEILKADNEPVGYLHYKDEDQKVFLSKIYLKQAPTYSGLGQVMLEHVIDHAIEANKTSIYLTVNKNNQKAIRFYERNEFIRKKSETFDIGNGYVMDDYIYEKNLASEYAYRKAVL